MRGAPVLSPRSRRAFLRGTSPARAGGARCIVEADTTREPHHLGSARSLVAVPVERDDPPAAVAAAFLVPRRRRRGPASATERVHSGTALRATVPPRSRGRRGPARHRPFQPRLATAPLIDFSRTSVLLLRPARSAPSAELSVRRSAEGDQIRTQNPAPGGELAGWGVLSRCLTQRGGEDAFGRRSAAAAGGHCRGSASGGDPGDAGRGRHLDDMLFMPEMRQ